MDPHDPAAGDDAARLLDRLAGEVKVGPGPVGRLLDAAHRRRRRRLAGVAVLVLLALLLLVVLA